jgi:hypothetical protein
MIEYNPDIKLNLRKKDIEKYVISHSWQQIEHPNKHFQVFDGVPNNDGKPIRLALPINEQPQDTDLRIYQAIQTIAGVEDRSIKERKPCGWPHQYAVTTIHSNSLAAVPAYPDLQKDLLKYQKST